MTHLDVVPLVGAAVLAEEAVPDGLVRVQQVEQRVRVLAQAGREHDDLLKSGRKE